MSSFGIDGLNLNDEHQQEHGPFQINPFADDAAQQYGNDEPKDNDDLACSQSSGYSTYSERRARRLAAAQEVEDQYNVHRVEFIDTFDNSVAATHHFLAGQILLQYGNLEMEQAFDIFDLNEFDDPDISYDPKSNTTGDRRVDRLKKYREQGPALHEAVKQALVACKETNPDWTKGFFKHMEAAILAGVNAVRVTDFLLWYPHISPALELALRNQSKYYHGEAFLQRKLRMAEVWNTRGRSSPDSLHPEILHAANVTTMKGNSTVNSWEPFGLGVDEKGISDFEMCWENREGGLARVVHIKANLKMRETIFENAPEGLLRWKEGDSLKGTLEHKLLLWGMAAGTAMLELKPLYTVDRIGKKVHEYCEKVFNDTMDMMDKVDCVQFSQRKLDANVMVERGLKILQGHIQGGLVHPETEKEIRALQKRLRDFERFHKTGLLGEHWERASDAFDMIMKAQKLGQVLQVTVLE